MSTSVELSVIPMSDRTGPHPGAYTFDFSYLECVSFGIIVSDSPHTRKAAYSTVSSAPTK